MRPFVIAVFYLTRQLRKRDDRNIQFLAECLQAGCDFRDLLHTIIGALVSLHQLNVVDDQHIEAALALEPPGAGGQLGDGYAACLVDIERNAMHHLRTTDQLLKFRVVDFTTPDFGRRNFSLFCDNAGCQLLRGHLEREKADHTTVFCL